jgi:hypothetical protein
LLSSAHNVQALAQMGRGGASIAEKYPKLPRRSENKAAPSVVQQRLVRLSSSLDFS